MKTRSHRIQPAALILAVASIASAVFPHLQPGVEPSVMQGRSDFCEGDPGAPGSFVLNEARQPLPMSFEVNRGQADDDVKFLGRGNGFALALKSNEAVFALHQQMRAVGGGAGTDNNQPNDQSSPSPRLSMKLEGARSTAFISGVEQQVARANYVIGNDPSKWIRNVETYSRVLYSDVYPGVDLMFYGKGQHLEYDFRIAPGADPRGIKLRFEGSDELELSSDGALILRTAAGELRHDRPVAYQEANGSRVQVAAEFKRLPDETIGFHIGDYDPTQPLVIDPVLVFSTYLGGSDGDFCRGILLDSLGNALLVGDSFSSDFLRRASPTNSDVFIGTLNRNGLILTYTYFGGEKNDTATGLAVDSSKNFYLCGTTESPNFPIFNSFGSALLGASDAFVVKLVPSKSDPTILVFEYASVIGGSGEETGVSIAVDGAGSAYITGRTSSLDFPVSAPIQASYKGGDSDAFVTKLSADGKLLIYSTLLGGSGTENLLRKTGIAVDSTGNAYVSGDTQSGDFPTKNALRSAKTGAASTSDGFVAKINPGGSDFVYSSYFGGSEDDFALAVAADQSGNAYVTGRTKSTSFSGSSSTRPTAATTDAFVAKLNASGSTLSYLTFVGGNNGDESGNAIAVDGSGNVVIAGSSGNGVSMVKAVQSYFRGGASDALIAKLGLTGAVTFSTYVGGSGEDVALAVGLDGDGAIYVTGVTDSKDFLTVSPLIRDNGGGRDIFVAKIDPNANSDRPVLLQAVISGKHLLLYGQGFNPGAVLRVNDEPVKTRNEDPDPTQILFAKKAAKRIPGGQTVQLQIENSDGKRSNFLFFTKPLE